ncbi:hypothetical protein BDB00DRAFT_768242 [Zychaea mexicana]|uniref:uncharacterized protein n=1 Tax=Zychaea mexicana TaxID=64656 RepID=UPI0022FEA47B|nr:uncharacterized protein BDB00DRAFT_768242 [Zychaea mexicana]KAI9490836.1 hypothetical protein BDB00DRAFT_768242 [Zychaea mexicana]
MSSLSSPSSPSFPDNFPSSSNRNPQTTVYDILHSSNTPSEFYSSKDHKEQQHSLVTSGCSHLAHFKKQRRRSLEDEVVVDDDDRWDLFNSYRSLVRYSLAWHKSRKHLHNSNTSDRKRKQYKELPLPQCSTCHDPLSRLHVCLHSMDFGHRTLYCNECDDYVYDNELSDVIVRQETIQSETRRRKRARTANTSWEPTSQDISAIVKNSTVPSCRGIRGLCNMGNTCFMNVILQSFIHNPLLKAYFLSDQHNPSRCNNKFCLCCEMDNLFAQVYSGKKEPYGPCTFLQSMWMSLKELAGYAQQDAHEFFISALNNIHAGCEGHSLSTNCTCIVHRTFAGLLQSNVTCLKCGNVTSTVDPMLDISLSLRSVDKKKKGSPMSNNKVADTAAGKENGKTKRKKKLERMRITHTHKKGIRIPKSWVPRSTVAANAATPSNHSNLYTLFAVINHQGKIDTGHYTMFSKHRGEWFKFEDHNVTTAFQKDVLDSKA